MSTPTLLTSAQVAAIRRKTPQALAMERARNEGPPYIQDGGRILYDEDELNRWLAAHRVDPALAPKRRRDRAK